MHRLMVCATLACAVLAAACSSSTSPKPNTFNGLWIGTWVGSSDVSHLTVAQTGDSIVGVDSEYTSGSFYTAYPIAGNVTGNAVNFTYTGYGPYKGTFITADSVAGYYHGSASDSEQLVWKKQ